MPEMPDVVTLTTISSNWGNQIRSRTVQRYSSVANRTTEHPSPSEGDLSYLEDSNTLDVYTGAAWVPFFLTNEVDGSVEAAGAGNNVTTTPTDMATVTLAIPAGWGSWKCEAYATFNASGTPNAFYRIRIDGTDQQSVTLSNTTFTIISAVGGRRTGMTTTGNRTIALRGHTASGAASLTNMFLYARAVRTS